MLICGLLVWPARFGGALLFSAVCRLVSCSNALLFKQQGVRIRATGLLLLLRYNQIRLARDLQRQRTLSLVLSPYPCLFPSFSLLLLFAVPLTRQPTVWRANTSQIYTFVKLPINFVVLHISIIIGRPCAPSKPSMVAAFF